MQVKIKGNRIWYEINSWNKEIVWIDDGQISRDFPPCKLYTEIKAEEILAVKIGKVVFTRKEKGHE